MSSLLSPLTLWCRGEHPHTRHSLLPGLAKAMWEDGLKLPFGKAVLEPGVAGAEYPSTFFVWPQTLLQFLPPLPSSGPHCLQGLIIVHILKKTNDPARILCP